MVKKTMCICFLLSILLCGFAQAKEQLYAIVAYPYGLGSPAIFTMDRFNKRDYLYKMIFGANV